MGVCDCGSISHNPAFCPQAKEDRELAKEGCGLASLRINVDAKYINASTVQRHMRGCQRDRCVCELKERRY